MSLSFEQEEYSASFTPVHAWQSIPDEEYEEEGGRERGARRELFFPLNTVEKKAYEQMELNEKLAEFEYATPCGVLPKDRDSRIFNLACFCKEYAHKCEALGIGVVSLNDPKLKFALDGFFKLSHNLKVLDKQFADFQNPAMMLNVIAICRLIMSECVSVFNTHKELDSDGGNPLAWFLRQAVNFMDGFHENPALMGQRITKEWLRYDFVHHIAVPASQRHEKVRVDMECAICQEDFTHWKVAFGFQRRCDRYPTKEGGSVCEGNTCKCITGGIFHDQCLSELYFSQGHNKTFAKCPTCNAEWCLHDVVSYEVEQRKRAKK